MDNELRNLRLARTPPVPAKDMVQAVKRLYPKFDKPLLSKCERGEIYGVQIRQDAMDELLERFPSDRPQKPPESKKHGRHRFTCRISCRLSDETYSALQRLIKSEHYRTMQDWMAEQVRRYIAERQGAE